MVAMHGTCPADHLLTSQARTGSEPSSQVAGVRALDGREENATPYTTPRIVVWRSVCEERQQVEHTRIVVLNFTT